MFSCHLLEVHSFLMSDRKGVDLEGRRGGKELRRLDGGEIRIYCIRKDDFQ